MPYRLRVAAVRVVVVLLGLISAVAAQDQQGTLVVALDTLGAQTMDPILEGRAPHAHYRVSTRVIAS
jgi:peptide/nickel transport system substrate-binding protein